jgi:integrase
MENVILTISFLKKLSVGDNKKYADITAPGLQVWVGKKSITFYFRKKFKGRLFEMTIGNYPSITLEEARQMALEKLAAIANYEDIESPIVRKQPTVKEALDLWLKGVSDKRKNQSLIRCWIPIEDIKIADLKTADISNIFYAMKNTPIAANHALKALKAAFNKTFKKYQIQNSVPFIFDKIAKYPEKPRVRMLLEDEAPKIIDMLKQYANRPLYADQAEAILLMLFTGQRKSRVLGISVEQIDIINRIWHVPGNDIKRPVDLPLNDYAWEIISKRITMRKSGNLFLWRGKPMKDCRKTIKAVCDDCGIKDLHLHDLRRSLGSWMLSSGASIETVSKILGHSSIRVTEQVYAHLLNSKGRDATTAAIGAMFKGKV